jgi:putative methionine-R-sulfoxide reductase with GAF domain
MGSLRETLVFDIDDASTIGATVAAADINANDAYIPAGAYITSAYLIVETAFAGATAQLNVGLYEKDGTVIDADGIDATIAVTAIDAAGDVVACDGAAVGGVVVADTANDMYVAVDYDTAAFTAGKGKLIVEFIPAQG